MDGFQIIPIAWFAQSDIFWLKAVSVSELAAQPGCEPLN